MFKLYYLFSKTYGDKSSYYYVLDPPVLLCSVNICVLEGHLEVGRGQADQHHLDNKAWLVLEEIFWAD